MTSGPHLPALADRARSRRRTGSALERLLAAGPVIACGIGILSAVAPAAAGGTIRDGSDAAQIYLRDCAQCHSADLSGSSDGPPLADVGAASVDYELSTGRMPLDRAGDDTVRHDPAYDGATIDALVAYITRADSSGTAIPRVDVASGDVSHGGELYRLQCAACHEWAGQGGVLRYGEAPSLQNSTATQVAEAVRVGPGTMPVFGKNAVDERELSDLAAYVGTLQNPRDRGGFALWHLGPLPEGLLALAVVGLLAASLTMIGARRR